jgi:hypothetical protein
MDHDLLIYLAPAMRIGWLLAKPTFDLLYHKAVHAGIHSTMHRFRLLHHKAFRFLPDALMLLALLVLDLVLENHGHHAAE